MYSGLTYGLKEARGVQDWVLLLSSLFYIFRLILNCGIYCYFDALMFERITEFHKF